MKRVNESLLRDFTIEKLEKILPKRDNQGRPALNQHCIQSCVNKLGWKKQSNNKYHYYSKLSKRHQYSEEAVNQLIERITADDNFVVRAKNNK